jgi:resuscitation-promoting factor RpfA
MAARLGRPLVGVLTLLDCFAVWRLTPSFGALRSELSAPHAWLTRVGTDAALGSTAGALLWVASLWLAIGLLTTLAAAMTGRRHGRLDAISRRFTPELVRRLVLASTGASIALSPIVMMLPASAAPTINAVPADPGRTLAGLTDDVNVPLRIDWPVDTAADQSPPGRALSEPDTARDGLPGSELAGNEAATGRATKPNPVPPSVVDAPLPTTPAPPLDPNPQAPSSVVVRPGDSLWRITGERLGPLATDHRIAVAWPYWYRANRRVIGGDPSLLRPGERLTAPAPETGS